MNYIKITSPDIENGLGFRVTLWISGCSLHCKGCHNPETHNPLAGKSFNSEVMELLLEKLEKPYIQGLTLSGGNPLDSNPKELIKICKTVKEKYPKKDIWLFSGYTLEEIIGTEKEEVLDYVDFLIDGPFILRQKDTSLAFKGSKNQKIYKKENNKWNEIKL